MRWAGRTWRRVGFGLLFAMCAFLLVRTWVVPAIIVSQIRARYQGKVRVGNWWLGLHSSGLDQIGLAEGTGADDPEWISAEKVQVDVSLLSMLRGRFTPNRITIDRPKVKFRLDLKGQPITRIPLKPVAGGPAKGPASPLPEIEVRDAELTLQQEGREPMIITRADARLGTRDGGEVLDVKTDDPTWGGLTVTGHFDNAFRNGQIRLATGPEFRADPVKLRTIPFIPAEVWGNIEPRGPVDARVTIDLAPDSPRPVHVLTELTLKGADANLAGLQIASTETTGHVRIDDATVKLEDIRGKSIGGFIAASGTLDFSQPIPRFGLDLRLKDVNVTRTPASWQLHELGATGRLSGKVDLKVTLPSSGADLTGTAGEAVIEDGSFQGIPIKSLSIGLKAEGSDLRYETKDQAQKQGQNPSVSPKPLGSATGGPSRPGTGGAVKSQTPRQSKGVPVEVWEPVLASLPILRIASGNRGFLGGLTSVLTELIAYQVQQAPGRPGKIHLPKTVTTRIELEEVDLATILAKVEKFGVKVPVPIAGRFSIKAEATIPIGSLRDIKSYAFRGDASLSGASIDHVDIGLVALHVDFSNGILDLSDLRGQLLDRPGGDARNPPARTTLPERVGDLRPGGFRGKLRASISPTGPLTASFEGRRLPVGELFAPMLPVPTPVSGELTIRADAEGDVARLADTGSWKVDAGFDSRRITYQGAKLDQLSTDFRLKESRLSVNEFTARLAGQPLEASGSLTIAAPYRFDGRVNIAGWEIAQALAFVPGLPRPAPASGRLDAKGQAVGTLMPFQISTQGAARILKANVVKLPLGGVVFQWQSVRDGLAITGLEASPLGGKVSGEARVPLRPGGHLEASLNLKGIDTAQVSASLPVGASMSLSGKADGTFKLSMPMDASTIDAEAVLVAPDLTVRPGPGDGIRVHAFRVTAKSNKGHLAYDATADSLGAKIRFHGSAPIQGDLRKAIAQAEFQAAGFRLNEAWKGAGIGGGLAELDGVGAIDANLRAMIQPMKLWGNSVFELRELRYGQHLNLGWLKGTAALTPASWRLDDISGELFGGVARGEARGDSSPGGSNRANFDFRVDRASLSRMLGAVPSLANGAEGFGTLRASGQLDETLRASAEMQVPRAVIHGLAISELRFPAEVVVSPASGVGTVHARHWVAHLAGGIVRGNGWLRLGEDRSFQSDLQLNGLELDVLSRLQSAGKHNVSGKVSGNISLSGPNTSDIARFKGRVDLDLDEASLVQSPVFRELDRFLGASRGGGLFDDGDIHGTFANRTLFIDSMTLEGRLVQLHASGTVTFDGGLDLQLLVNTKDVIPQSGMAIVSLIPGLGQALGRGEEFLLKLASFLEKRLLKFRIGGTVSNPTVQMDAGVAVTQGAAGFFSSALKIPIGGRR